MKVQIYTKNAEHQKEWLNAFAAGLVQHKVEHDITEDFLRYKDADLHVFWSIKHPSLITRCLEYNKPFICIERGYIDRENFASVNLNGLNGRSQLDVSDFRDNDYRRLRHGWNVKPLKLKGREVIIMGQMPGDSSLDGRDIYTWARKTYDYYEERGYSPRFKPHPLEQSRNDWEKYGKEYEKEYETCYGMNLFTGNIEAAIKAASMIHTYSSNAGVDAWLGGVPCIADSPVSMLYNWQTPAGSCLGIRHWLNELSYRQYNKEEFESGESWELLKGRIAGV